MTTSTTAAPAAKKSTKPVPHINVTLIKGKDGTLDRAATLAAAASMFDSYVSTSAQYDVGIAKAVAAVFDANPGVALNAKALASFVTQELQNQGEIKVLPANIGALHTALSAYISANSSGVKPEDRALGKLFATGRGRAGGTKRWSDVPVTATEAVTEEAELPEGEDESEDEDSSEGEQDGEELDTQGE